MNEAFSDGGPALLVAATEQLSTPHVDHYRQVDFTCFQKMVDALGGIDLCAATSRHDQDSGDPPTAGQHQNVDGKTALAFMRDPKGLPNGDLDRILTSSNSCSDARETLVRWDPDDREQLPGRPDRQHHGRRHLRPPAIRTLTAGIGGLDPPKVRFTILHLSTADGSQVFQGSRHSVALLDATADTALFAQLSGTTTPPAASGPLAPSSGSVVPSAQVWLTALNSSSGSSGLAGQTAARLRSVGLTATRVATAATTVRRTTFRCRPISAEAARTLAAARADTACCKTRQPPTSSSLRSCQDRSPCWRHRTAQHQYRIDQPPRAQQTPEVTSAAKACAP